MQDVCNECWNDGYSAGRKNTVLELTEVIKSELHKLVINEHAVYVSDIINILEVVKQNVLCEEAYSSQSIPVAP